MNQKLIYDTAYSDEQVTEAIVRCVKRYGRQANVRSLEAKLFPPRAANA